MQKLYIDRRASDNKYFHRDFHIAFDRGLMYLGTKFGGDSVDEYLKMFALEFYAPLISDANNRCFSALREHIESIYEIEEAPEAVSFVETDEVLQVFVTACPAVKYMRNAGHEPSEWYEKSTSVVYKTIAEAAGFDFEMISYVEETGAAQYRFTKGGASI